MTRKIDRAARRAGLRAARDTARFARRPDSSLRRRRAILTAGMFGFLLLLVALDRSGALLVPEDDHARYDGRAAAVVAVIDGDTLRIAIPDPGASSSQESTRVRILGIDAPELRGPGGAPAPFAIESRELLQSLIDAAGGTVTVRLEPSRTRDRYGRLLAHIDAGGETVGAMLLERGMARVYRRGGAHRYSERYEQREAEARRRGAGVWALEAAEPRSDVRDWLGRSLAWRPSHQASRAYLALRSLRSF